MPAAGAPTPHRPASAATPRRRAVNRTACENFAGGPAPSRSRLSSARERNERGIGACSTTLFFYPKAKSTGNVRGRFCARIERDGGCRSGVRGCVAFATRAPGQCGRALLSPQEQGGEWDRWRMEGEMSVVGGGNIKAGGGSRRASRLGPVEDP
eukprot:ctg_3066.g790